MYFTSKCFTKLQPVNGETGQGSRGWRGLGWGLLPLQPCPSERVPGPHLHFSLTDAHSLCLDLIGSVDKKTFLQYDSDSNTFRPLGLLREKINVFPPFRSSCLVSVKQNNALLRPGSSASMDRQPSLTR
uniref:Uncharacterized protein n=1 Tax=Equus asinus asinus TaxID=83772 RepID=A0A8C4LJC4_EQUAS